MFSHSVKLWQKSRYVPRRTWFYLLIRRNFHYLITTLAIFAFVSILLHDWLLITALTFGLTLLTFIFWEAFNLDLSVGDVFHPHHKKGWTKTEQFLKPIANLLLRFHSPSLIIICWLIVTAWLLISLIYNASTIFVVQSWLLYLIILFFSSWLIHEKSSNWFFWLSVFSIFMYSWAVSQTNFPHGSNFIVSNISTLLLLGSVVHFLLRLLLQNRAKATVAEEITRKLSNDVAYLVPFEQPVKDTELVPSLNEIAVDIARKLAYDHVYIVLYDKKKRLLYLKGANTPIADSWKKHPWSDDENSITAWVALHKQEHLCSDTTICDSYFKLDDIECTSEVAVPILVEDECVGVLDVESPYPHAFDETDITLLWQLANAMAAALAHRRQINREIDKVYELFERLAGELASSETFSNTLDLIVSETGKSFGADLVMLYPHAIDTQLPLPQLAWAGESCDEKYLRKYLGPNNRVLALLSQRNPKQPEYYSEYADEDSLLLGPNNGEYTADEQLLYGRQLRFVKREKIKSTAFLSLGIGNDVVGSLFLNYRKHTHFDQDYRQRLKGLGAFLSLALLLKRQIERLSGPLAGVAPVSHSKAAAAFEAFRRAIERGEDPHKTVEQFKNDWAGAVLIEAENLRTKSLQEGLSRLKFKVNDLYPEVNYDENIDPIIGQFPIEFQTMIYGLVSESVANALFHGEATEIHVKAKKENGQFMLIVNNDGVLMKESEVSQLNELIDYPLEMYWRRSGIRALLIDARNWFGAKWRFESRYGKTVFVVMIPFLETNAED